VGRERALGVYLKAIEVRSTTLTGYIDLDSEAFRRLSIVAVLEITMRWKERWWWWWVEGGKINATVRYQAQLAKPQANLTGGRMNFQVSI
jgi:hypothetical protein